MPTYTYRCKSCLTVVERLVVMASRDNQNCLKCGEHLDRKGATAVSVDTPLDTSRKDAYSPKEIDQVIGSSADQKWLTFHKKREEKLRGAKLIDLPIKPGQTFNPENYLGNSERKRITSAYSQEVQKQGASIRNWDKKGFRKIDV